MNDLITQLLNGSDDQLDYTVKELIKGAKTKEDWEHICKISRDFSLVSGFTMSLLELIYFKDLWKEDDST